MGYSGGNLVLGVQGSGFMVQGSWFRVHGSWFMVHDSWFMVQGSGCRIQGSGCRVQGAGFRVQGSRFQVWGVGCGGYSGGVEVFDLLDARLLPQVARDVQVEHLIQA